jgi:hypothetical protein
MAESDLLELEGHAMRHSKENRFTEGRASHDAYFSADVETDGPIPGPFSMLSFALVYAGSYDGDTFERPKDLQTVFYVEIKPISDRYEPEALRINKLDRDALRLNGRAPRDAMDEAASWVRSISAGRSPVLVAYPLSFDWTWLYWYFVAFSSMGSPFAYSRCFDVKTAVSIKGGFPISASGRSRLPDFLTSHRAHTHHAVDDAVEQAEIFANVFEWKHYAGKSEG